MAYTIEVKENDKVIFSSVVFDDEEIICDGLPDDIALCLMELEIPQQIAGAIEDTARLIAAAPDLLAAAKDAYPMLELALSPDDSRVEALRAAIEKAEGKA